MSISFHRWLGFSIVLVAAFLTSLDFNIINVSIPAIRAGLGAKFSEIQLVIAGYGLAYSVGLITAGRLGDLYGRKRILMLGMSGFALASASCGLSPSPAWLIGSRVVQGITASLMFPQVLSIIQVSFRPRQKSLAFSLYGMTMGLGNVCGNIFGGLLTQSNIFGLSWRPIFLINLPIIIVALLLARPFVRETRSRHVQKLDLPGAGLVTVALSLLIYPLSVGHEIHWPPWTFGSIAVSLLLLFFFAAYQEHKSRRKDSPLMETALFRQREFALGLVVALLFFCGLAAILVILTVYMQLTLGYSPFKTGLMFTPFGFSFLVASLWSSRLAPRLGKKIVQIGTTLMGAGVLWLIQESRMQGLEMPAALVVIGLLIYGTGQGLAQAPLVALVLASVDRRDAGSASGVLSTVQQFSYALGMATIGTVFFSIAGHEARPEAYLRAFGTTLWINLALLAMTCALSSALVRNWQVGEIPLVSE